MGCESPTVPAAVFSIKRCHIKSLDEIREGMTFGISQKTCHFYLKSKNPGKWVFFYLRENSGSARTYFALSIERICKLFPVNLILRQNREQFNFLINFKMKFKSFYLLMACALPINAATAKASSDGDVIILDLSKATTPLTFDEVNGMWNGTFDDDETEIESQVFSITHGSISDYSYWYGFTASNSTDNAYRSNTLLYQYSNMAKGGILLNEDNSIKTNDFGAPVSGKEMPYLVGFPKSEITFNTGESYQLIGAYFNLNTYTFYSILYGDGFSRSFTQGDKLTLTVHGIDAEENEKTLDIILASFDNGCLNAATGWKYVDLSSLGVVEEIYFTMSSTDSGQWGMNTPAYFCMDKISVKKVAQTSAVSTQSLAKNRTIKYNRSDKTISLDENDFAVVVDSMGNIVMTSNDASSFSVEQLPAGVYVVKSGNSRLKFAR